MDQHSLEEVDLTLGSIALSALALVTGLIAAWRWYEASQIQPTPNWRVEPVIPALKQMSWDAATLEAFQKAGELNARAALWTAASVALSALSSITGWFAA
ncbi:hypothetical protein ACQR1Y_11705 [Bradyrhizobium sp. HKCCYLRH3099]|uniref:hypothetical protein n=1 Tax=unclassified Bradyrhizobium TaxID=2631580 RepID=UPI003EBBCE04